MGGKINLYNLGDLGVDSVSSPLHAPTGSWQQLQNAEFSNVQGQGGVKKRGSLRRLNADALNGGANILVLANMPLETDALVGAATLTFLGLIAGGGDPQWATAPDRTTFTSDASVTTVSKGEGIIHPNRVSAVIGSLLYTVNNGGDKILKTDGSTDAEEVSAWPTHPGSESATGPLLSDGTALYCPVIDTTDNVIRVYRWLPGGTPTLLGSPFTYYLNSAAATEYVDCFGMAVDDAGTIWINMAQYGTAGASRGQILNNTNPSGGGSWSSVHTTIDGVVLYDMATLGTDGYWVQLDGSLNLDVFSSTGGISVHSIGTYTFLFGPVRLINQHGTLVLLLTSDVTASNHTAVTTSADGTTWITASDTLETLAACTLISGLGVAVLGDHNLYVVITTYGGDFLVVRRLDSGGTWESVVPAGGFLLNGIVAEVTT